MNAPVSLVTNKPDKEYATELKARILEAYKPLIEVLQEATNNGFICNCTVAMNQATGKLEVQTLQILKGF